MKLLSCTTSTTECLCRSSPGQAAETSPGSVVIPVLMPACLFTDVSCKGAHAYSATLLVYITYRTSSGRVAMRPALPCEADTHTTLSSPAGSHVAACRTGKTTWAKDGDRGRFECHPQQLGAPAAIAIPSTLEIANALNSREQWRKLAEERRQSEQKLRYGNPQAASEESIAADTSCTACDEHLLSPEDDEGTRTGRLVLPAIYELQATKTKPQKTQSQRLISKNSPVNSSPRCGIFDKSSSSPADTSPSHSANASFSTKSRQISPIRFVGALGPGRGAALMPSPRPQAELTLRRSALQSQSFTLGKTGATALQQDLPSPLRRAGPGQLFSPRSGAMPPSPRSGPEGPNPMPMGLRGSSFTFGSGHGGGMGSLARPL